jgi:acetyltransferase-like isoleucine patch superfamily enzyme
MFYTQEQLEKMNFKKLGKNVLISDKSSIYNAKNISIGDHTRIDDFAILSAGEGGIEIGSYVHIACFATLIGKGKIVMKDFSGISSRVSIYSSSDNYNGEYMTNPCIPPPFSNTIHADVTLGKHVVVGSSSVILPGITLGDGCSVGSMSLVNKSFDDCSIIVGIPAKMIKSRLKNIFELEKKFKNEND